MEVGRFICLAKLSPALLAPDYCLRSSCSDLHRDFSTGAEEHSGLATIWSGETYIRANSGLSIQGVIFISTGKGQARRAGGVLNVMFLRVLAGVIPWGRFVEFLAR